MHGRIPSREGTASLKRFRRSGTEILVATTMIEVDVDVPLATVMLIEIAEEDLRRRGMGDLAGLRQSGEGFEGVLDADLDLLLAARDLAASRPGLIEAYAAGDVASIAP